MDIKDSYLHGSIGVVKAITVDADILKYTLADINNTNKEVTLPTATTTTNGLLSKEDKIKLDTLSISSSYQKQNTYTNNTATSVYKKVTIIKDNTTSTANTDGYGIWVHSRQQHYLISSGLSSGSSYMNVFWELGTNYNSAEIATNQRNIHIKLIATPSSTTVTLYIATDAYTYFQIVSSGIITLKDSTKEEYDGITSSTTGWINCTSAKWSDSKVLQTNNTDNANYRLLFSSTADDTAKTESVGKSTNLQFNPYTGTLSSTYIQANGFKGKATSLDDLMKSGIVLTYNRFSKPSFSDETSITVSGNANGVLWVGTHGPERDNTSKIGYGHMLGFVGGEGALYHKVVTNGDTSKSWRQIAYTTSNITGNANTATTLATKRKLWGQEFDGSADVSGNMTGVGNISINSANNSDRFITFDTNKIPFSWRLGYLGSGSDNANYFVIQSGGNSDSTKFTNALQLGLYDLNATFSGIVIAPTLQGNLDGTYVDKLTGYQKATTIEALTADDTLNEALGKLEHKLNTTYDLVAGANDNDETIENLKEVLDVLSGIKDTETIQSIIGKYLPLAGGTMKGTITSLNIQPKDNTYSLGTPLYMWKNAYIQDVYSSTIHNGTLIYANNNEIIHADNNYFELNKGYSDSVVYFNGSQYKFNVGANNPQLIIAANGNVGIGDVGGYPAYKLHVGGGEVMADTYHAWSGGFIKNGSSDSDVLLGGGGHKAITSFFTALGSNTTNVISITVGDTTKSITKSKLAESLGLGDRAYDSTEYLPLTGGQLTGDLTLYNKTGDSPSLIFQRGTATDGVVDWKMYVTGGVFKLQNRTSTDTWDDVINFGTQSAKTIKTSYSITASSGTFTVAQGTSPLTITSNTKVDNLNADYLDGYHAASLVRKQAMENNSSFNANNMTTDLVIYASKGDVNSSVWDNFGVNKPAGSFSLFHIKEGNYSRQLLGVYNDRHLYTRSQHYNGTTAVWSTWDRIALTSDIPESLKNPNTLTLQAGTFSAKTYDGSSPVTVNIPTKTSHLTNDSGYLVQGDLSNYVTLNTDQTITGIKKFEKDLILYADSGDSPSLLFQKGTETDEMTDWKMYTTGGMFKLQNRAITDPWDWKDIITINQSSGMANFNYNICSPYMQYKCLSKTFNGDNSWYTVYKSTLSTQGDYILLNISHSYNYVRTESLTFAINIGYPSSQSLDVANIVQLNGMSSDANIFKAIRVRHYSSTDNGVINNYCIDVQINQATSSSDFYVTGLGRGTFVPYTKYVEDSTHKIYITQDIHHNNFYSKNIKGDESAFNRLTLSSGNDSKIILNNTDTDGKYQFIVFKADNTQYGALGTDKEGILKWNTYPILHTNNYNNYAVSKVGKTIINSASFDLSNTGWVDTGYDFENLSTGTYIIQVTSTNLVASGVMSIYQNLSDTIGDEIPLHVYKTAGWRPYLRTYDNKLQISSTDTELEPPRTVTIKITQIL